MIFFTQVNNGRCRSGVAAILLANKMPDNQVIAPGNHGAAVGSGFLNNQLVRVMKLTLILLTVVFANIYANGFSQTVTYSGKNVPIETVLTSITDQTGYVFFYNTSLLKKARPVSIQVKDKELNDVLQTCFKNQPLDFSIQNRTIVITERTSMASAIPVDVRGKVTDEGGQPLPGVTVQLKGSSIAVSTSPDGTYVLKVPDDAASTLIFKFIGMEEQEVKIAGRYAINVVLHPSVKSLSEVVVVGYGTQKKENLTGSVSSIGPEAFESRSVSNVGQALQGVAPGLNVYQGGKLGGSMENRPTINVRGVGTIGQGSNGDPLILIDGMQGDINALNPQDIDNISVLKDAAASSIYGSRAPFGVILVTTKRGKSGKTSINANSSIRSSSPVLLPRMMDSYTFATYFNDSRLNSGQGVYFTAERLQRIKDYQNGVIKTTIIPRVGQTDIWADGYFEGNDNVDWYRAIYKNNTPSQEHTINASGGKDNITYYISGGILDQTGLMVFGGDSFRRYNTTAKINGKLSNWASVTYIGRFSREEFERPSTMTDQLDWNIMRQGWPTLPLYDNNGYLYNSPSPALGLAEGGRGRKQGDNIAQQLKLTIEPIKGWKVMGDVNYSINDDFYHWDIQQLYNHNVAGAAYIALSDSKVNEQAARTNYLNTNLYTEYTKTFGNHNFKALAGVQSEVSKYRFLQAQRSGIIVPELPSIDVTSGTDPAGSVIAPYVAGRDNHWSTSGYFGRLNYNYKERYLFEANLRYDGSSRFRDDRRWIYSPSASAGWNVSREAFWEPLEKYVNSFKIRGSYGKLSNQNTTNLYPTYVSMPTGTANGSWLINGAKPNTASAPGLISSTLTWEKIRIWNLGTDMSFLDNRLSGTFDYYTRFTDDMIGPAPELPVILGVEVPRTNNTNLKTTGFDLNINWHDRLKNGFGYNVGVILSDSRTMITDYPNPTGNLPTLDPATTPYLSRHMMGEIWGYRTKGIAKTQAEMDAHLASLPNGGQNAFGSGWKAGDIMFEDVNGDGKITAGASTINDHGDMVLIGNSTPRYSTGLNLGVDWKGVDVRGFFQGVLKRDYFQNSYYFWGASSTIYNSAGLVEHTDYFRDDPNHPLGLNLDSYYPRPLLSVKSQKPQTKYLQDASYVRLKNLQIGYTLPQRWTRKIAVQRFRLYLSGENIWTISKMATMFDPETIDGGWNGSVYPLSKVYSFGLNITL